MKTLFKCLLLLVILFTREICFSDNAMIYYVEKVKNISLKMTTLCYSVSGDDKTTSLYFPDFSIMIEYGTYTFMMRNKEKYERVLYSISTAMYQEEPEYVSFTQFIPKTGMFFDVEKISYYPLKKTIIGYGGSSFSELKLSGNERFFIIVSQKEKLQIFCFESENEFEKMAKKILNVETIELQKTEDFIDKTIKGATRLLIGVKAGQPELQ